MNLRRATIALSLLGLLSLLGCGSPLVGLECREGFVRCGTSCVDLRSDEAHCGACAAQCGVAEQCIESSCVPERQLPDAGGPDTGDGGMDGSTPNDGGPNIDANLGNESGLDAQTDGQGSGADSAAGDDASTVPPQPPLCTGPGSPTDCICGFGQLRCDLSCIDPNTDRENCGGCDVACTSEEYCAAGVCAPRCELPLILCADTCVDVRSNDQFCGRCDRSCLDQAGSACIDGDCVGRAVGHVVLIGHDMSAVRTPMQTLVGNAVFLPRASPVRVLMFDASTTAPSKAGVTTAIDVMSQSLGRSYVLTTAMAELVGLQLSTADVFVINVQQGATDMALQALGTAWSAALDGFLFRGGMIVLLDAGGSNMGTHQILTAAGLLDPDAARVALTGRPQLTLVTPSDAIGAGVPTVYQSEGESAGFELDATEGIDVVADPSTLDLGNAPIPVVFHIVKY